QWTISLSASPRDATVEDGRLLSTHPSGLHQTETAISRKHNLREDIVLLSWRRTGGTRWDYGTVMAHDRWTAQGSSLENRPPKTYGSIFGGLDLNDLKLFGELATSTGVGPSMLGGFVLVKDRLRWISSLRRYPAGFQGPRSQPFREWSSDRLNEMGLYQGLSLRTGKHHLLTYGDIYRQMSGDGESGRPVHGFEVAGTWSYRWRGGQGFFRWKRERKTVENSIVFPGEATPQETWRESWRVRMATAPRRPLTLQIQGDRTTASPGDTRHRGHGLSLRVRYSRHPWRTSFNWTAFSVNDYSSRIYVWDINLPGELRSKTFSSTGHSAAFLVGTSTTTGATMSIRARSTWRFSRQAEKWLRPTLEGGFQMDIAF
ncbi:MAG: hypothetical protein ACE5GH_07130, partial [Fidelibacterota bacterium]